MTTKAQKLGDWGEKQVAKLIPCPNCDAMKLRVLRNSFPSLDLICGNCATYMAQVKTVDLKSKPDVRPKTIPGAGWKPLETQIARGVLRDLYVVGAQRTPRSFKLVWIDRVPGNVLLANAQIFVRRMADIKSKDRKHPMFSIMYSQLPESSIERVFQGPPLR